MGAALEVVELFMHSFTAAATLAAAELGVADAVGDEPQPVEEIARTLCVDAGSLRRLLRGLAASGIFTEVTPGCFAHTPRSAALRTGAPGDARAVIRMFGLRSTREGMVEYEHAIRTGESAFARAHGGAHPFEILAQRPDEAAVYHEGMSVEGQGAPWIVRALDLDGVETVVDVGGGRGVLLAAVLARHPRLRGVLFDLPSVVAEAAATLAARKVTERCEVRGGDLRSEVPRGDGYLLKHVLHGWPDDECVALLARVRAAAPSGARVYVIENVMPEGNAPAPCKVFDLFLLLGGARSRVRGVAEFERLFSAAGLTFRRVVPVRGDQGIVEAVVP